MIFITNEQGGMRVPRAGVRLLARRILPGRRLSVAFVTDATIRRLNRRFLGHDRATDVLAFRLEGDVFGEVVVSAGRAAAEARRRGLAVREELLRYVAHGFLHLRGWDDRRPRDRARMWARQERELRKLRIRNRE